MVDIRDIIVSSLLPRQQSMVYARGFNLLSSRANLHLSCNPAGRSHCRLQNHHEHIKHHHRGMSGSPDDVGEVPMIYVKQRNGCRTVFNAAEGLENEL